MSDFCWHCGGPNIPGHPCDGKQGKVEASALEPVAPYRPHENVRQGDPDTSHEAAYAQTAEAITIVQQRVEVIHKGEPLGLTDEQQLARYVAAHGPTPESSPRKRRCDLVKAGLIIDSGERRLLSTGRRGIVWLHISHARQAVA